MEVFSLTFAIWLMLMGGAAKSNKVLLRPPDGRALTSSELTVSAVTLPRPVPCRAILGVVALCRLFPSSELVTLTQVTGRRTALPVAPREVVETQTSRLVGARLVGPTSWRLTRPIVTSLIP